MRESRHIMLVDDVIRYRLVGCGNWDLPISDIRVIGEATNQNGPLADYSFCFATGPEMWLEASFYAEGRDEFLHALGARLGSPLEVGLCNSTDFASRVLWPPSLRGEPMFQFDDVTSRGLLGLLRKLFGISRKHQTYSERVAAALTGDR